MRISNIVSNARQINQEIDALVLARLPGGSSTLPGEDVQSIQQRLQSVVSQVNQVCRKKQAIPEDLPTPSFRAYQWMKFLSQRKWLLSHISAVFAYYRLLEAIFPAISRRSYTSRIQIESYYSGYLFRNRQKNGKVFLEINEGFISAPDEIKRDILAAALKRRTAKRIKAIKAYTGTTEYSRIQAALQDNNGANHLAGRGQQYDLATLYAKLNRDYFKGQLEQPRLVWSPRKSVRRLGTYQPDSDTITISKRLDSRDIPQYLVEYVLYHEMLHKKIGLREVNGRRYAHTSEFRKAEKQFAQYKEAEEFIKKLNQRAHL